MKKMLFASLVIILIAGGVDLISHIEAQEESYPAKEFKLPERYKNRVLPPKADNRTKYLRTPFEHMGHPCAFAASICYNFTYEINFLRDLPSDNDDNLYPYTYAYHFYNDGSGSASCANIVDGYRIAMATGVPNNTAMGGFTAGYPTKWLNTYDKYYEAMHNRVVEYYFFDCKTTDGFQNLKQWLYDHASGTTGGGLANFNVDCMGIGTSKIASGPEAGKTLITAFGSSSNYNHSLTVVGYNDSISYDFNNDGQITNEIDINRDGKVDLQDREEGAFCIINSHIVWDEGFAYCAYNLFSTPPSQGGIGRNNEVYCLKTVENFEPKYTLKATITHSSRENIKIYAGIASDINATEPTKVKSYAGAFNYAGGDFPMEGENM